MRILSQNILLTLFTILICSSINTAKDAKSLFVKDFNQNIAPTLNAHPLIKDTYATKEDSTEQVYVFFQLSEVAEGYDTELLSDILITSFKELSSFKQLVINENQSIQFIIKNHTGTILLSITIDKTKVLKNDVFIESENNQFIFCDVSERTTKIVMTLNKSLPDLNEDTGVVLEKVIISENRILTIISHTKDKSILYDSKEEMREVLSKELKEKFTEHLKTTLKNDDINVIRYEYKDSEGNLKR